MSLALFSFHSLCIIANLFSKQSLYFRFSISFSIVCDNGDENNKAAGPRSIN